jgi:hypothetical protein
LVIERDTEIKRRSQMQELRTANLTWEAAKRTFKDRRKWRTTVEVLCFTRSEEDYVSQVSHRDKRLFKE